MKSARSLIKGSEKEAHFSMESSALRAGLVGNRLALLSQLQ